MKNGIESRFRPAKSKSGDLQAARYSLYHNKTETVFTVVLGVAALHRLESCTYLHTRRSECKKAKCLPHNICRQYTEQAGYLHSSDRNN